MHGNWKTLAIVAIGAMVLVGARPASADDRVMMGYYATFGDLPVADIPFARLTHISHAFLTTDEQGQPVTGKEVPNRELTDAAHQHQVKVLLSLGGGNTTAAMKSITADNDRMTKYVDEVVKLVVDNHYDGVDIDWEHPRTAAETRQFVALVKAFRTKLDQTAKASGRSEPYILTAAVSATEYFGKFIDVDAVLGDLDWLNVMTYDFSGPWDRVVAHNSPLMPSQNDPGRTWRSVTSAMEYWQRERGVPADKLVLGLPFYGRGFPASQKYAPLDRAQRADHQVLSYVQIRQLLKKDWKAEWDDEVKAPWMMSPADTSLLIAYDDRNSIYRKTVWARGQQFRGVFFWALHQDRMSDGKNWLVEASYRAWPKGESAAKK
ncbi:glycoside hydrolase family 18 protein [Aeoliella sp. ICT_H6.2]|uniref:chitinase n=1 Tax=Aeoliella straminimaris TaxID=2954799 RepID=A0A9X2FCT7_9BACT|nr:glycoside hydrolase family 18 protein [Aeoliella straminimaris]